MTKTICGVKRSALNEIMVQQEQHEISDDENKENSSFIFINTPVSNKENNPMTTLSKTTHHRNIISDDKYRHRRHVLQRPSPLVELEPVVKQLFVAESSSHPQLYIPDDDIYFTPKCNIASQLSSYNATSSSDVDKTPSPIHFNELPQKVQYMDDNLNALSMSKNNRIFLSVDFDDDSKDRFAFTSNKRPRLAMRLNEKRILFS